MREIKQRDLRFRAWDREGNRWVYDGYLIEINGNGRISYAYGNSCGGDGYNGERFFIQQYTGLKDKNGWEVYEGDIVRNLLGESSVVSFGEGDLDGSFWGWIAGGGPLWPEAVEVIGNIYENPELVTGGVR